MGAVTETSSRKRMFSMQQTDRSTAWNSALSPYNLAREPKLFEHHEKKLRSLVTTLKPNKGHPHFEVNGILQTADHFGASEIFQNELALIRPCVPNSQRPTLQFFPRVPILPAATSAGIKYREMQKAMISDSPWHLKLAYSEILAEEALDRVGRPRAGVRFRLRPTESLQQKFIDTKRELDDYKLVVQAVNSSVPLNANGGRTLSPDLERLKQGGTNLQQGPRNLYYVQSPAATLSQNGTPWSESGIGLQNGEIPSTPIFKEASNDKYISHDLSITPRAIRANSEVQASGAQSEVNGTSNEKANHHKGESGSSSVWRTLYDKAINPTREARLESNSKESELLELKLARLRLGREETESLKEKERQAKKTGEVTEAFTPLTREEETAVDDALRNDNRRETLVMHEETNIEVTRAIIQCLLPGAWLNDEVINVYMQLLKERELREPNKFLKCHFFNTFFYNKLFKDKQSYDYKSVRRWTTQKKIGYSLVDCDKILVPIHQDIHWCLAVINFRDQRFEYLDSLKGHDENVLQVLARYVVDEAKDKGNKVPDVTKWECAFPDEIPEQLNGCDCGMFMVKYADFHSRGAPLSFSQEHMEYFRKRTVNEILQLEAK